MGKVYAAVGEMGQSGGAVDSTVAVMDCADTAAHRPRERPFAKPPRNGGWSEQGAPLALSRAFLTQERVGIALAAGVAVTVAGIILMLVS